VREPEARREPAPRREREERGGRGRGRDDRSSREPRRDPNATEGPDEGWNGPVPDFLKYTLGA
jgi:hypothetical protein